MPQSYNQFSNKQNINISLNFADQYLKNIFHSNFEAVLNLYVFCQQLCRLVSTLSTEILLKNCKVNFPLYKIGGTYTIMNNVCWFFRSVTQSFGVTAAILLRHCRHPLQWPFLTPQTNQIMNSLLNKIKLTETTKLNKRHDTELYVLGHSLQLP
jgi:hypothetical protein